MEVNMERRNMICIACPLGCRIEVFKNENESGFSVTGNQCKRGKDYGVKEMTNPTRLLTTTVKLRNSYLKRLPVRTDLPIPKEMIASCMSEINRIEVCAPLKAGVVLIRNILNTGVNVITSRSISAKS
jgi:CxxC motif-containing protein